MDGSYGLEHRQTGSRYDLPSLHPLYASAADYIVVFRMLT
jgi:hypothetical protein